MKDTQRIRTAITRLESATRHINFNRNYIKAFSRDSALYDIYNAITILKNTRLNQHPKSRKNPTPRTQTHPSKASAQEDKQ